MAEETETPVGINEPSLTIPSLEPSPMAKWIRAHDLPTEKPVNPVISKTGPTPVESPPPPAPPQKAEAAKKIETPAEVTLPEDKPDQILSESDVDKLSPNQQGAWGRLKGDIKKARQLLAESRARLEQAEKRTQNTADLDNLRKERDELSQLLKATAWERSPEGRREYDTKVNQVLEVAKRNLDPGVYDKVAALSQMPPSKYRKEQLDSMLQESSPTDAGIITRLFYDLDSINIDRENKVKEGAKWYEETQRQRQTELETTNKRLAATIDEELVAISDPKDGLEVYMEKSGDKDWAEMRSGMVETARNAWDSLVKHQADPKKLAKLILWGAAFPNQLALSIKMGERIKSLEAELTSLKKSTPGVKTGEVETGADENDFKRRPNESMHDYMARTGHRVFGQ